MVDGAQKMARILPDVTGQHRRFFSRVNIHQGDDRSSDHMVQGLVGHDPNRVPPTVSAENIFLQSVQCLHHAADFGQDVGPEEAIDEADRTTQVASDQTQQLLRGESVSPDAKIHANDEDGVVEPRQEVVQVVVGETELRHSVLELLVDGCQLLVRGLHLFP